MSDRCAECAPSVLEGSTVYQEYLLERYEILRHKWFISERAGRDVGFEFALTDWIVRHRSAWRRSRLASLHPPLIQPN